MAQDSDSSAAGAPATPKSVPLLRDLLWLAAAFGLLFFFALGSHPLNNPDEGRYAEIPREMLVGGDWVLPRLNDVAYYEKPPLVYWVSAVSMKVFGQSEWVARSTPALFALAGVLITFASVRRLWGRRAGLFSAVILGTSLLYYALARVLILDMAVSVLISATLFCFILGVREPAGPRRRWFFYGLYVSAALATLSKGLIGVMLPGAVMFLWLLLFNQWRRLLPLYLPTGLLLFLGIALPWHLLAHARDPEWARFYLYQEHWLRFTTRMHSRYAPWYFFIPVLLLGFFPWTLYLLTALRERLGGAWKRRREEVDAWFFVVWAVFIFLFFSRSQSKLIPYILPLFPALAALLGAWFSGAIERGRESLFRTGLRINLALCGLLALVVAVILIHPALVREREQVIAARPWLVLCLASLLVGVFVPWRVCRRQGPATGLLAQALCTALFMTCVAVTYPRFPMRSSLELAQAYSAAAQPGDKVYHYRNFAHDFVYYSGNYVGTVAHLDELGVEIDRRARESGRFIGEPEFFAQWESPDRVWVLIRNRDREALLQRPGFRHRIVATNHRYSLLLNQP